MDILNGFAKTVKSKYCAGLLDCLRKYKKPLCFPPWQGGIIGGFASSLRIILKNSEKS